MSGNLLVVHGGGPTAVMNSSLYGIIREAEMHKEIGSVYGALGGTAGVLAEKFIDFSTVSRDEIELLKQTPSTAIGTSRTPLNADDYDRMVSIFKKHNIKYILFNGGNGSMDTCGKLCRAAKGDLSVVGIPKTIDNDIAITDHCPGYGSAARYLAQTVAEIVQDVRSMPIHVSIVESMGRNAGWITAAASLAQTNYSRGPDLIYLPEVPFNEDDFLNTVQTIYDRQGYAVVVASEGLKKSDGTPIVDPILKVKRDTYFGDVGAHLAELVIKRLNIKARSEKPGIAGRSSILCQSSVDREEAILVGAQACRSALSGKSGIMIGIKRIGSAPYLIDLFEVPIEEVMMNERMIPKEFIKADGTGMTEKFADWCCPLIGGDLLKFAWFNKQA